MQIACIDALGNLIMQCCSCCCSCQAGLGPKSEESNKQLVLHTPWKVT
jgi:hypothetical protein